MWRFLFVLGLFAGMGSEAAPAQQWRGTAAVDVTGGYQTNLYLDPVLGTWNADVTPALAALTPRLEGSRITRRTRLDATVRSRLHPRRSDVPQLTQSTFRFRYHLTSEWTLGAAAGGTRYRFTTTTTDGLPRTVRDSWWLLPSLQWTPTSTTVIHFRTGLTQRFERSVSPTDRQTSGLASLRASHWLTDRLRGSVQLYYSNGRTSGAGAGFGGTGGGLTATYRPTSSVSVRGTMGVEQLQYERPQSGAGTARDRIGRIGGTVEWTLRPSIVLVGRTEASYALLAENDAGVTDLHVSGGVRLRVQRDLGETPESFPRRRVCRDTDDGVRIRVPYEGTGTLHVTGDFNNWSLPGVPLDPTDGDTWQASLDLPPGRYAYRLRVVEGDEGRWIDLPSYAQTASDPFGGTNGICIVH